MEVAINESFDMSVLGIVVLTILGLLALRILLRQRNQASILLPVAVLIGVFLLIGNEHRDSSRPDSQPDDVTESVSQLGQFRNLPVEEALRAEAAAYSPRIEETANGSMLVMPLSTQTLEGYLGADGSSALEKISDSLPAELRQAYFMVPISGTPAEGVPGLHALATAIARMTNNTSTQVTANLASEIAEVIIEGPRVEAPTATPSPDWLSRVDEDPLVVTSGFEATEEEADTQLKFNITSALLNHAWQSVTKQEPDEQVLELRRFQLTSRAVDACIQERFNDNVALGVSDSPPMQRHSALLAFPEELEAQAVRHVRQTIQNERTWTVSAAGISLSLVVMLAAGLMQFAGSDRRFARYIGVPLAALMILPGIAISASLVADVAEDDNTDIPSPMRLPDTIIDHTA